ncbi:FkbM family methyltransferase [Burkholderia territorii]|uniref:FkbM family methyltransferase n=1 Tax=Burkholderia territorii TaxID=1503055 RepID=UPI0007598336|nr:FkbM family methyltransferase [Burkholderia territorii]KWA08213.1 hypothetical protein WT37_26540 [Burkholderia territorii]
MIEVPQPGELVITKHGVMLVNRNDVFIGHSLIRYGEYCEGELDVVLPLIDARGVVVEVGSNIGSHTVPLAQRAASVGTQVIAFEPQPVVFQNLCANLALNGIRNTRAWPVALGDATTNLSFAEPDYDSPGNFGGVAMATPVETNRVIVPCAMLDDVLAGHDVSLIKLDVEGFELKLLKGGTGILSRSRPALYLENDRVDGSAALIDWLWAMDYRIWWHFCPLFNPTNWAGNLMNVFGKVHAFNMLALPREYGGGIPAGLGNEVTDLAWHPLCQPPAT